MRDFVKLFIVGVVMFMAQQVYAETYKVLIVPDNIVTETANVDSYIYDECAEFFADGVISLVNKTDLIKSQPVSVTRDMLKKDPSVMLSAKNLTNRFKNSYNIDYAAVKKLGQKAGTKYVLLITSAVDAQNYIMRRTLWDRLNIPGATVVDPAYKISTYAVLVDTSKNERVWDDTFYKTISVCEHRIITRGPSPQTEQLEKIRDYSKYICPQIAHHVQASILPANANESTMIDYGFKDVDNAFTKKCKLLGRETNMYYKESKEHIGEYKEKRAERKKEKAVKKAAQEAEKAQQTELKVKATPVKETSPEVKKINYTKVTQTEPEPVKYTPQINSKLQTTTDYRVYETPAEVKTTVQNNNELEGIDLKIRKPKHNLYGDYQIDQPALRGYTK